MKRFHISRMTPVVEVLEVKAHDVDEAISMLKVDDARLLSSTEGEPVITNCWEKPTGTSKLEDNESDA